MSLLPAEYAEWFSMICPIDDPKALVVVLKVAIDESGTHENAPCISVAACFGEQMHWTQFIRDWSPIAKKYPKGFHATKARDADNEILAGIVARWLHGFALTIDYEDLKIVTHRVRSEFGAEYQQAIRIIAMVMRTHLERSETRWMTWVLQSGHREQGGAGRFLDMLLEYRLDFGLFAYTWVGKDDYSTHAADIAAYIASSARTPQPSPLLSVIRESVQIEHLTREDLEASSDFWLIPRMPHPLLYQART